MDTPGWNDDNLEDEETFNDLLKYLKDEGLTNIKAIFWTIHISPKSTKELIAQAKLIDKFNPGAIWDNVIIICKQARNPEKDAQGALTLGMERMGTSADNIQTIGYTFFDDPHWTKEQLAQVEEWKNRGQDQVRKTFNIFTREEVKKKIYDAIEPLKPQKLKLKIKKCDKCGFEDDIRLGKEKCHGKFEDRHKYPKSYPGAY